MITEKSDTTQATHLQAHYPPGRRNVNDMTPQMMYFTEDRFVTALASARPASSNEGINITPTVQMLKKKKKRKMLFFEGFAHLVKSCLFSLIR